MFDEQLSDLLRMQQRGANGPNSESTVPELIPVNATMKWVHIFPGMKDTAVTEGDNLWSHLPFTSTPPGQNFG